MVCSICGQPGHNRRTCPQRNTTGLVNSSNVQQINSQQINSQQSNTTNRPTPPITPPPPASNKKTIKLINMRNENYLIYWVVGNLMIEDLDDKENPINYMGMLRVSDKFGLNTMIGHRFYLIPHCLDLEPPYHPQTDKQFFIKPYLQLNIHEGSNKEIYIDDGEKLSELNRWKFNALKLDYLIREMIKLGAKNNETLDVVLDLHEDITLDSVSEWYKDIAGVPSKFTNIT